MRAISVLLFAFFVYFSFALPAGATITVDPCPGQGTFGALCNVNEASINPSVQAIIQILMVIGMVVAIIFLIWGGVKWITAGGDKAGIESARSTIIGAVVGLVLIFIAFFLYNIVLYLFGVTTTGALSLPRLVPGSGIRTF